MPEKKSTDHNKSLTTIARVITYIFSPITATFSGILITYQEYIALGNRTGYDWLIAGLTILILNIITLWFFIKSKLISNWDLTNRKQRPRFLALATIYALILFGLTWKLGYREAMPILSLFVVSLAISSLITLFWKISFHTFAVTLAVLLAISAYSYNGPIYYGLLVLPFIVAWTRVHLGKHTLNQTIGGIVLAIAMLWVWMILPVEQFVS